MKKFKLGIVDDHTLFAEGLSNIIADIPNMELCFIANSGEKLFDALDNYVIDFLLLDINLPKMNGLQILKIIKKNFSHIKVMILSMYQPTDISLDLNNFMGDAYVLKISGKNILLEALQALQNEEQYFDPNIVNINSTADKFTTQLKLTKREIEIINLIAVGKTSKEIASLFFVSELTIKTHRKNINEKIGTKGIANMIRSTTNSI